MIQRVLLLVLITASAHASPADSGRCPWKLPFAIESHAAGTHYAYGYGFNRSTGKYDEYFNSGSVPASLSIHSWIDTAGGRATLTIQADSLMYVRKTVDSTEQLTIVFVHGTDSISSIDYFSSYATSYARDYWWGWREFSLFNLEFDDNGLFCSDSSMNIHRASLSESEHYLSGGFVESYSGFSIGASVDLSGIFHPTHLVNLASVATSAAPSSFALHSNEGILECSFDPSARSRTLEIYSTLGARITSLDIAPEQRSISLPRLVNGLYFIRMGEAVLKVSVSE